MFKKLTYSAADFSGDALAGAVTGVLLVPQALAYALLAGMPPAAGLFASIAPALVYALFGTSRVLSVGPVAVVSLMTAAALGPLFVAGSPEYSQAALILALLSGVMLFALGALRLGMLINFLSYPVLAGFSMGAAILIIISQVPQLLGLKQKPNGSAPEQIWQILHAVGGTYPMATLFGGLAIAWLLIARGPLRNWLSALGIPLSVATSICRAMPLLLVMISSALVAVTHWDQSGLQVVGRLNVHLPMPRLPTLQIDHLRELVGSAALIGLVGFLEGISIAQLLARRHREIINGNREFIAIGLANIVAAMTTAMPVAGSLSRSVVNDAAEARTRFAGVLAAALVASVVLIFAPLLSLLPRAVLAGIIVVAVLRLIEMHALVRVWRYDRADGIAWVATAGGVLLAGAEAGLVAGLVLSLLLYLWKSANPHICEVGRVPYSELFLEVDRHHELDIWPQLLLIRVDESLFFGNASAVRDFVASKVAARPGVTDVIINCAAVNSIDVSALAMLEDLIDSLSRGGVTVHLAEVKGTVMDRLAATPLRAQFEGRIYPSMASGILTLASPPI